MSKMLVSAYKTFEIIIMNMFKTERKRQRKRMRIMGNWKVLNREQKHTLKMNWALHRTGKCKLGNGDPQGKKAGAGRGRAHAVSRTTVPRKCPSREEKNKKTKRPQTKQNKIKKTKEENI